MGGRAFVPESMWTPEYREYVTKRDAARARFGGYDTRKDQVTAAICTALENVVAFLAFVFIFGTLAIAGCGLVYLLVGGMLNILGVEVPGISSR